MNRISQFLNQPVDPSDQSWRILLRNAFIAGGVVSLIFWFFQPFGIRPKNYQEWFVILGFGFVSAISLIVYESIFRKIVESRFGKLDKVGKLLLWNIGMILMVAICNFIYHGFLNPSGDNLSLEIFLLFLYRTIILGILPFLIVYAIFLHQKSKNFQKEAHQLSQKLEIAQRGNIEINLKGEGKYEGIKLLPEQILYIQSTDNYATIFYQQNETIQKHLIRSSLTNLNKQLIDTNLKRCHRSFIVNIAKVIKTEPTSNGLELSILKMSERIPVSRKYQPEIKSSLKEIS